MNLVRKAGIFPEMAFKHLCIVISSFGDTITTTMVSKLLTDSNSARSASDRIGRPKLVNVLLLISGNTEFLEFSSPMLTLI